MFVVERDERPPKRAGTKVCESEQPNGITESAGVSEVKDKAGGAMTSAGENSCVCVSAAGEKMPINSDQQSNTSQNECFFDSSRFFVDEFSRQRSGSLCDLRKAILNKETLTIRQKRPSEVELENEERKKKRESDWMRKLYESDDKIDNMQRDMKCAFSELFKRMDEERNERKKEFELFKEENRLNEERMREENRKKRGKVGKSLEGMQKQIDELREGIERMNASQANIERVSLDKENVNENVDKQIGENELRERLKEMETLKEKMERDEGAKNFIIYGWSQQGAIGKKEVIEFLEGYLGYKGDVSAIQSVSVLGKNKGGTVCVRMRDVREKEWVMQNKSKLKEIEGMKVYIENDRTKKQRDGHAKIVQMVKDAQQKGSKNVKIKFGKALIDNVLWVWNERHDAIVEVKNGKW